MKKSLKITVFALFLVLMLAMAVPAFAAEDVAVTDENIFATLFEEIGAYTGEIFCALSLVGSLILAIIYKKGLFPLLSRTLGAVSAKLGELRVVTEETAGSAENLIGGISVALAGTQEKLSDTAAALGAMEKRLAALTEKNDRAVLTVILDEQINLLSDIFASTSLPQYKKDEIGERVASMRQKLAGLREEADEK